MKNIIFFLLLFSFCQLVFAQTYNISQGGTVITCSGTFYDSGGAGGNYSLGENNMITFCPGTPEQKISLQFTSFDIDGTNSNVICFFDGVGTGGVSYGCNSNLDNLGLPFIVTSNDVSGCLTITFNSVSAIATGTGWTALISCTTPCQQVFSVLDHTDPPSLGGNVDICPGDTVTFYGKGNYPQNGIGYTQSDATSTFLWNFGDGTTGTGSIASHVYTIRQGYDVKLKVTDLHGCISPNDIGERVRVSTIPVFPGTNAMPDTICIGSTSNLTGVVTGTQWSNMPQTVIAGTTFLPDGSGVSYQTSLNFDVFNPGQTLTNVNDIIQMCANMEHSYMGDLTITLSCPNGSYVTLLDYANNLGGGTFFGVPIDNDADLNPGTGWTYCWSPNATIGDMNSHTGGTMAASPPNYNETGENGHTFESLVGCPLNGDWTITVTDNLNSDNGFIFWWGLDFNPAIFPSAWSYTPTFQNNSQSMSWSGNGIITPNGSMVTIQPTVSGIETYIFTATDNAGCPYDTSLNIFIRPQSDPLCCIAPVANAGMDAFACGFSYQLNAALGSVNTGMWYFVSGPGNALFSNPTQPNAVVAVDQFGTYILRWREIYNSACKDSDDVTIKFTSISFTTTYQDITCNGFDNGRASVTVVPQYPPYTYLWTNGAITPTLTGLPPGTFVCTIRDFNGCDTTTSITIQEPFPFNITPSPDIFLCYGEKHFIYANPLGGVPPYDFFWNGGLDSASIFIDTLVSTIYIVRAEDANGCRSDTFKINVYVDPPIQMQLLASDDTVCPGNPVLVSVIVWGGDGGPYYVYLNNETLENPPIYVYPEQTTEYIITVRDKCGTYGVTDTITVVTYPDTPIDFSADIYKGCQPLRVTFNEVNNNPGAWYLWVFGNIDENNTSVIKNPVHVFDSPGLYDVTLTVTSREGCVNTSKFEEMIEVYPKPDARFINDPQVSSIVNSLIYFTNYSTGATTYYWSFGDGDSSEYINPQHYYRSINTFNVSLIAESSERCTDTAFSTILIQDEYTFFAPTAFSPDKDGMNDIFYVYGNGIDPDNFQMFVFDRWGATIFETKRMDEGWNGIIKDVKRDVLKSGVYTWYVIYKDFSGVEHQRTGPVTLIH